MSSVFFPFPEILGGWRAASGLYIVPRSSESAGKETQETSKIEILVADDGTDLVT